MAPRSRRSAGTCIEQFFDPLVNTRTDEYGGSLENRTRFAREVLLAVRAAVSDSFIVGFRMAVDQCLTGGLGPDEMIEIARSLASTGAVDLFSVSGGTGATRLADRLLRAAGDALPEGVFNERAIRFRREVGVPTLVAGRNVEPEMAEEALAGGVDLIAMTRALIADPDLPLKVADGRRPRPCIGLNDGCIGRLYTGMPMYCSVNPAIRDPVAGCRLAPADAPAQVVVVGGGVAGLEAARAAALRGHSVVLFERRPLLGGRARLAGLRSGRERWHRYVDWLLRGGRSRPAPRSGSASRRIARRRARRAARRGHRRDRLDPPARGAADRAGAGLDVDELLEGGVAPSGSGCRLRADPRRRRPPARADGRGDAGRHRLRGRDRDDATRRSATSSMRPSCRSCSRSWPATACG